MSLLAEKLEELGLFLQNRTPAGGEINEYDAINMEDAAKVMLDAAVALREYGKYDSFLLAHGMFAGSELEELTPVKRKKCRWPEGLTIKPDGIHPLSAHVMAAKEIHRNVTVEVGQCVKCGHVELSWYRQEDTEDEILGKMEEEPDEE